MVGGGQAYFVTTSTHARAEHLQFQRSWPLWSRPDVRTLQGQGVGGGLCIEASNLVIGAHCPPSSRRSIAEMARAILP